MIEISIPGAPPAPGIVRCSISTGRSPIDDSTEGNNAAAPSRIAGIISSLTVGGSRTVSCDSAASHSGSKGGRGIIGIIVFSQSSRVMGQLLLKGSLACSQDYDVRGSSVSYC